MRGRRREEKSSEDDEEEDDASSTETSSDETRSMDSSSSSSDDQDYQEENHKTTKKKTTNAFSRAFASLVSSTTQTTSKRGQQESDDDPPEYYERSSDEDEKEDKKNDDVYDDILPESKSRRAERAMRRLESQKRKRQRLERARVKEKGHFIPSKIGANIEDDLREKRLKKTATHGVAQLFNAIAKVQRNRNTNSSSANSLGAPREGGKTKAKFLAELKKESNRARSSGGKDATKEKEKKKVWEVLTDDYMMGRGKMKDFDAENGFFDKHKEREKNVDGSLRDDDDDDDDAF